MLINWSKRKIVCKELLIAKVRISEYIVIPTNDQDGLNSNHGSTTKSMRRSEGETQQRKLEGQSSLSFGKGHEDGSDFDYQEIVNQQHSREVKSFDDNDLKTSSEKVKLNAIDESSQVISSIQEDNRNEEDRKDSAYRETENEIYHEHSTLGRTMSQYSQVSSFQPARLPQTIASKYDKIMIFYDVRRRAMAPQQRRYIWLLVTGALEAMKSCHPSQSYSAILSNYNRSFPNPNFKQISVDLPRTFQDEEYYRDPRVITAIDNILRAYSIRNPTIGYCQGFNFIVGRLLMVMNEEEAFWTFCQIIETIMPLDYYSNMVGALIDQKVFGSIFKEVFPKLADHLEQLGCDSSLITFQWFACFFSYNVPFHILERIWDIFFLKGCKILFRMSLAIIHMIQSDLLKTKDFQQIFKYLETFPSKLQTSEILFQLANLRKYKISNRRINHEREKFRDIVLDEIQGFSEEVKNKQSTNMNRIKFLNKFYMYTGIAKQMDTNKTFDITKTECIEALNCDQSWPVCLFDFTYKNRVPEYFAFRVDSSSYHIIDNYFGNTLDQPSLDQSFVQLSYRQGLESPQGLKQFDQLIKEESEIDFMSPQSQQNICIMSPCRIQVKDVNEAALLIERNYHFCSKKSIDNFKVLLRQNDKEMYNSDHLDFQIRDEVQSKECIRKFVDQVNEIRQAEQDSQSALIKCLQRSNSDYLKMRPVSSRLRTMSNESEDLNIKRNRFSILKTPSLPKFQGMRARTKSGHIQERGISLMNLKEENHVLFASSIASLYKNTDRQIIEKLVKDMKTTGKCIIPEIASIIEVEKGAEKQPTKQREY